MASTAIPHAHHHRLELVSCIPPPSDLLGLSVWLARGARADLLLSLAHTALVLLVYPVVHALTTSEPWSLAALEQPTPVSHAVLLALSFAYYAWDSMDMLLCEVHPLQPPTLFYLIHHALCCAGLAAPLLTGVDSALVLAGFVLGELANPPRLWAQLVAVHLRLAPPSSSKPSEPISSARERSSDAPIPHPARLPKALLPLYHLHSTLSAVHFLLFTATRVAGIAYIGRVVWPLARSPWTVASACGLAVFSAVTITVYALRSDGVQLATIAPSRPKHA